MEKPYLKDKLFERTDFTEKPFETGEYDGCTFRHCNLSGADLSNALFMDCRFESCDLSMARLKNTTFQDVTFAHCKQLGLRFDDCSKTLLSFSFEFCVLNFSSFAKLKLKGVAFRECRLQDIEFAGADLTHARFDNCDLDRAVFQGTVLEGADFRTAYHFSIDPEANRLKKARFSANGLAGLLEKYAIVIE